MWRYHVRGKDNKLIKLSDYIYSNEQNALDAASKYVKGRVPRDEVWDAMASYQSTNLDSEVLMLPSRAGHHGRRYNPTGED
jgi:hypothetical protein